MSEIDDAKVALDKIIRKARVHFYKPIQIAEILYQHRTDTKVALKKLETYRTQSKKWRDEVCIRFLGRISTSSARYQDNLFAENAIPPKTLEVLGTQNKESGGAVEAYIYQAFHSKHFQLSGALNYCLKSNKENFEVEIFLNNFWKEAGLKRSIDKIFEIIVYALFEVLTARMNIKIDIYYEEESESILSDFSVFAEKVLNLNEKIKRKTLNAHFHRLGVTNAADRGLDMYANFGSAVQVKHVSFDKELVQNVTASLSSQQIIIVCKSADEATIKTVLQQLGLQSRIQSIITIDELIAWYKKALTGKYANVLGDNILSTLKSEIKKEFPSIANNQFEQFMKKRGYDKIINSYWKL